MFQSVKATRGMVTASHHLAAQAGLRVLREGGNAIEAMIAAAATISVVYPHMNGLGGDGFWLISTPNRRPPRGIQGIGRVAQGIDEAWYRSRGMDNIPSRGPYAANTVAGTLSSWSKALEISTEWGGRLSLERLLEDAEYYAREGVAVTESQHQNTVAKHAELLEVPGWAQAFLNAGNAYVPGQLFKQPALANTLQRLAGAGLEDFYRGDLAKAVAADLERAGSPVAGADLAAQQGIEVEPLSVRLRDATLYNMPPPCQGLASLIILALFDRLEVTEAESFEYLHTLVEATKQAIMIRNRHVTDPQYMQVAPNELLTDAALAGMAGAIDAQRALPWPQAGVPGDTVWLGAVDSGGRAVSFIHSIYWEFGSGVVLDDTGIQWQNRGSSFSLNKNELNYLRPGRLPFHTNNPALALQDDGRVMVYGAMGGEGQPQTQSAIYSRYALYGQGLQRAITAPRWVLSRTWGDPRTDLRIESRFPAAVIEAMREGGHEVSVVEDFDPQMGHAGAIVLHPTGVMEGANDPRCDGMAAGY